MAMYPMDLIIEDGEVNVWLHSKLTVDGYLEALGIQDTPLGDVTPSSAQVTDLTVHDEVISDLILNGGKLYDEGIEWKGQEAAADRKWAAVAYGNGLFVATSSTGAGDRVMTSPDGINWTIRTTPSDNGWRAITYGNGLFVAVAYTGTGNRVMTSPDGINWTARISAADNNWRAVTYGNGIFVAVAYTGVGNRVMTSPDGINWTTRTSATDNDWRGITYGNGLFVAVAYSGTGDRVMTSPDGITWTTRTSAANNTWASVVYGNGLFVAVAYAGSGNRVMTSPDGINWTARISAANNDWVSVVYGNGLFVAVCYSGAGNRVMTSPDGITWTTRTSVADNNWAAITYGNGIFVAVSNYGTDNRVMTSGKQYEKIDLIPQPPTWVCIKRLTSSAIAGPSTNPPTRNVYGITPALEFTVNTDHIGYKLHVPDDWVVGSDINLKVQWTKSTFNDDQSTKTVKWQMKYLPFDSGENVNAGESTLTIEDTYDSAVTTSQIAETTDNLTIPAAEISTGDTISIQLMAVTPTANALDDEPAALSLDVEIRRYANHE